MANLSGMTIEECERHVGECVRIKRLDGKNQHMGRGKITGVEGKKALVLPFGGHRKEELIDPSNLILWKSKNLHNQEILTNRLSNFSKIDDDVAALLGKNGNGNEYNGTNGNRCNPWADKPNSSKKDKKKERRLPIQMNALPAEYPPQKFSSLHQNLKPKVSEALPSKPVTKPQEERIETMTKQEWLRKNCSIIFDCLVNGVQEAFPGQEHKSSIEATELILQTLVGDAKFVGLDETVLPKAMPLINEFAFEELDKNAGEITLVDIEELMVEKQILKRQKQIDPLTEIRNGNLDKKDVLRALIGPNGFQSTSELATFALRKLRGVKAD